MRERCDPTQTQPSHPPPVLFCGVVIACWHLMVSIRCRNVAGQFPLSVRRRERRHFPLSWSLRVVYHPVQPAVLATSQAIPRPRRRCHKAVKNGVISSLCLFSLSPLCLLAEQNDGHVYYLCPTIIPEGYFVQTVSCDQEVGHNKQPTPPDYC